MTRGFGRYVFIIVGMGASLFISSFLLQSLFVEKNPVLHWNTFTSLAQSSVLNTFQQIGNSIVAARPTPTPTAAPVIIQTNASFFDPLPAPTDQLAPTTIPTPTDYIEPTSLPTEEPLPTEAFNEPTAAQPTRKPTVKPTKVPTPTKKPKPTPIKIDFPKVVGDPLKQAWYGNNSLACYTPERFVQVYANAIAPDACYKNVHSVIDANIVTTTLLGRSVQVHKKVLAAFEAVAKTLDQYKADGSTYKFPSKTYTIKDVGTYVFRCNVNASTGDVYDTCQPGCVIGTHAFGIAVDINMVGNCNGCTNYDMPEEIWKTFELYGFRWGGHYPLISSKIDPMHFEYMRDLCAGL